MRLGIADHLGWAIAVTASAGHEVADRRRIELIEPGISPAPIHYESRRLDVAATATLVARRVRPSVGRRQLHGMSSQLRRSAPVVSISLRAWPPDFPDDIEAQPPARALRGPGRRDHVPPGALRAAHARGWHVHLYDAKAVVDQAISVLAERADEVLQGPRTTLGPPWTRDHRIALAATVVAAS